MSVTVPKSELKPAALALDVRSDFPIFDQPARGKSLVYLDSGATTQKPRVVIDAVSRYYETQNANIHRGNYQLSIEATNAYEQARTKIAAFLNVSDTSEIIFTRGTTDGINLVASSLGRLLLNPGDEVLISTLEHHSNIVPWQLACEHYGARLKVIPINDAGELLLDEYRKLLTPKTKIVAVTHLSNALGTINDIKLMTSLAHDAGAVMVVDGAQWIAHHITDIPSLDVDFYAFSGHKLYGPTGIGVLYGKRAWLEKMPPYQGGGDMIKRVTFEKTTYAELPNKFEAGTPPIAEAIGLGAAIDYVTGLGLNRIALHEETLLKYLERRLQDVPGLRIIGTAAKKSGAVSFVLEKPLVAIYDVGKRLDLDGIAVRVGHHCCEPLMTRLNAQGTVRASLGVYNTATDVDVLVASLLHLTANHNANTQRATTQSFTTFLPAQFASVKEAEDHLVDIMENVIGFDQEYINQIESMALLLPAYPTHLRNEEHRVHGCVSMVHLVTQQSVNNPNIMHFLVTSDAKVVSGLMYMLFVILNGRTVQEILQYDVEPFYHRIQFKEYIGDQRRNGLAALLQKIKETAAVQYNKLVNSSS